MNGKWMKNIGDYAWALVRWLITGAVIGVLCGAVGALFAIAVDKATALHGDNNWILYLLPLGGILIAAIYKLMKLPLSIGTDKIIATVRTQEKLCIVEIIKIINRISCTKF